ncbi:hypothetical protein BYT27DRAFT_7211732 [Phlegmacium glaucopus]|nr:hypothetical protein BYT27DRAFT_7211732 [Phlegmacium glaucopus]
MSHFILSSGIPSRPCVDHMRICSVCDSGWHADHIYTPLQSPEVQSFFDDEINSPTTSVAEQSANYTDSPQTPHAPPSTPITAQPGDQSLQFWSSSVFKATINFSPSKLPEHLCDGSWHYLPTYHESVTVFGRDDRIYFNNDNTQAPSVVNFFWGPQGLISFLSGPSPTVQSQLEVHNETESTKLCSKIAANGLGSSLDSVKVVSDGDEVKA